MEYYGYRIDPKYVTTNDDGKEVAIKWKSAGLGEYVVGWKDGICWFIKRNLEYRFHDEKDMPDKELRDFYNKDAFAYKAGRDNLRRLLVDEGKLSKEKDHVVVEELHFIADNQLVTVSKFVEDVVSGFDFYGLHKDDYIQLCVDIAVLLEKIHRCTVVHGDLKVGKDDRIMEGNIVVTYEGGRLVPYLIDFDLSFAGPPAANPENIPHSPNYESPEIVPFIDGDEERCESITVTSATDIFTLGIVYHQLWTGTFPAVDREKESAGRCIANDGKVTLNSKFNVKIGDSCGATLISLINWMLAKEPADRPTATQVIAVLKDELAVPDKFHKGADEKSFTELWYNHTFGAERLSESKLRELGVVSLKKVNVGGGLKYIIRTDKDKEQWLTIDELISAGYAKRKTAIVDCAWEEHNITMCDPAVIAEKGYVKILRTDLIKHRYQITTNTGLSFTHGYMWLVDEGLAELKHVAPIEGDEPWPGHGKYADDDYLASRKVVKILRVMYGDEQRYRVEFNDKAPFENVSVNTMKRLGYIK